MIQPSGYAPCACRDCFELTLTPGTACHSCDDAGCDPRRECLAAGAYGGEPETDPAAEIERVLAELSDPAVRARVERLLAGIPADALTDTAHGFWETPAAFEVVGALVLAVDAAAGR